MALSSRLRETFIEALDLDPDADVRSMSYRTHEHWDSLGHMTLVVAIEETFGIELTAEQLVSMESFDAALAILIANGLAD
jgi:acyl carrier protein